MLQTWCHVLLLLPGWTIVTHCYSELVNKIDRLQRVQNKAARLVCNASRRAPSSDLLHFLYWLPTRKRIEFKTASLCFKAVKFGSLPYLKSMLQPQSSAFSAFFLHGHAKCWSTSLGLSRFSVAGPRIWNGLPHELRQCNILPGFKSPLKTYYFRHLMNKQHLAVESRLRLCLNDGILCSLNKFDNW